MKVKANVKAGGIMLGDWASSAGRSHRGV